jgi:hypothetical protein
VSHAIRTQEDKGRKSVHTHLVTDLVRTCPVNLDELNLLSKPILEITNNLIPGILALIAVGTVFKVKVN